MDTRAAGRGRIRSTHRFGGGRADAEEGEDEGEFVRRAAANDLARPVKRADLEDNRRQAIAAGGPTRKYDEGLALLDAQLGP